MKPGAIVELPDGRRGTVVYHGGDGYGIKWGEHALTKADIDQIESGIGNLGLIGVNAPDMPEGFQWAPDALLGNDYDVI